MGDMLDDAIEDLEKLDEFIDEQKDNLDKVSDALDKIPRRPMTPNPVTVPMKRD